MQKKMFVAATVFVLLILSLLFLIKSWQLDEAEDIIIAWQIAV